MKTVHDLSSLDWKVAGFWPHAWRFDSDLCLTSTENAEAPAVPAPVPGSVQQALLEAEVIPDWSVGMNYRQCEWVENRHWIYEADLPDSWITPAATTRLRCLGLDGNGLILLNGAEVARFDNSHMPLTVDFTPHLAPTANRLHIIFECSPRWLGQFGYTSRMTDWKPRFNYYWDWTARLVQIGIWDAITLEAIPDAEIADLAVSSDADLDAGTGTLVVRGTATKADRVRVRLCPDGATAFPIHEETLALGETSEAFAVTWDDLAVTLWWPNGHGDQPLYKLSVTLLDEDGDELDTDVRRVGFKHVDWRPCEGAPEEADPWICVVNGSPVFLQGFNWTPVRPNFADVPDGEYRRRLELYRDLGVTMLRVWGGAFLGKRAFYDLCDELGLLVWQEFPLSSSGFDNYPPDDPESIAAQSSIARSFIHRRSHHVSLLLWSGGNELMNDKGGQNGRRPEPMTLAHPLLSAFAEIVGEMDPVHRFVPTSASGPRFGADPEDFGKGLHWDVHGPWKLAHLGGYDWDAYWAGDDALLRSESGCPGPSSADLIRRYAGSIDPYPGDMANPLWHVAWWWIEWQDYIDEMGREPETLEAYIAWGQQRQARALRVAASACKGRFPKCGGFIVWMGHDSFPCTANTSVIDFEGNPKPAAYALADVFRKPTPDRSPTAH